jgi:TonB family protein
MAVFAKHGRVAVLRHDDEPWGKAFTSSVAAHAALVALFMMTAKPQRPVEGPVLTEVNFVEQPAPEAPAPAAAEAAGGAQDLPSQSPMPSAAAPQVVSFAAPSAAPAAAQPVSAPIFSGPIAAAGEVGGIGMKKAALAPLISNRDAAPVKRGPIAMAGSLGTTGGKGGPPIALTTQGVEDIRRKGGTGIPLISQSVGGGTGPVGSKVVAAADGTLTAPRKAPVESLKAGPIVQDAWGKKNSPFSMEGPLKYRRIKVMQMPPYPRWAEEKGIEATVSFRIWVDSKGKVKENMYLEKTSGYSDLDAVVKESLLKFTFVPLPSGAPEEDEWGVATFKFELKK